MCDTTEFEQRYPTPFAGRRMLVSPTPTRCTYANPEKPLADFSYFAPGTFVVSPSIFRRPVRLSHCELIPLEVDGEVMYAVNVVHILNALSKDSRPSSIPLVHGKVDDYVFITSRLNHPAVFKLPETAASEVLTFCGLNNCIEDELPLLFTQRQLTGFYLEELWRSTP